MANKNLPKVVAPPCPPRKDASDSQKIDYLIQREHYKEEQKLNTIPPGISISSIVTIVVVLFFIVSFTFLLLSK